MNLTHFCNSRICWGSIVGFMKKLSRGTLLLWAFFTALSLCACGSSDDEGNVLIGTWAQDCDFADALADNMGDEYADFYEPLNITILVDFNEDGTYRMYVGEDSLTDSFNNWLDAFMEYSVDMTYGLFEEQGMTKEEADAIILKRYGMSMEEYYDTVRSAFDAGTLVGKREITGTYEMRGNKLYLAEGSNDIDESYYNIFTVDGNKMIWELPDGVDETEAEIVPGLSYPLEFEKR